jgi:hypothetical protein
VIFSAFILPPFFARIEIKAGEMTAGSSLPKGHFPGAALKKRRNGRKFRRFFCFVATKTQKRMLH